MGDRKIGKWKEKNLELGLHMLRLSVLYSHKGTNQDARRGGTPYSIAVFRLFTFEISLTAM
jgi:hypothetical protein